MILNDSDAIDATPVPWMHGAAGIISGAASMTLFYPLDFLRTRMHTYTGKGETRMERVRDIVRSEGYRGMYRGVKVAVGSHSLGWGMYLSSFRFNQITTDRLFSGRCFASDFTAAAGAATLTSLAVTPLNMLKVRAQLARISGITLPKGVVAGLRHIVKTEGAIALLKGFAPQLLLSSHTTIQVALYELLKRELWGQDKDISVAGVVTASAVSKGLASAISNPLEVVRTRLQDARNIGTDRYKNMGAAFGTIYREEGYRGFYRGVVVNVCRVIPTTVVAFVFYETLVEAMHAQKRRGVVAVASPGSESGPLSTPPSEVSSEVAVAETS